jgi:uncharacterized protein YkwD
VTKRSTLLCTLVAIAGCYSGFDEDGHAGSTGETGAGPTGSPGGPSSATPADPSNATATDPGEPTTQGSDTSAASQVSASEAGTTDMSEGPGTLETGGDPSGPGTTGGPMTTEPMTTEPMTTEPDPDTGEPPPNEMEQLCARWNGDRADLAEGTWDGSVNGCNKGTLGAAGHANALKLINLYRWIADLPAVTEDGTRSDRAQACALMMDANNMLNHDPPNGWTCYTQDGHDAAATSNISSTPGVLGIDLYMVDYGNETTMGHRRWILSNSLGPVGIGSTSEMSCLLVIGGNGNAGAPWLAWPPPGLVPYAAIYVPTVPWSDVDKAGWTVQSDSIDVRNAQVTVTEAGMNKPVAVNPIGNNFGSAYGVRFVPQGWVAEAGKTYDVALSVGGIQYSVTVVDCG